MSDNVTAFLLIFGVTSLAVLMLVSHSIGFKSGQVGALSGTQIEYQLVTNANNTVTWEYK